MKKNLCLFLAAVLLAGNLFAVPAMAEETETPDASTAAPETPSSQPTESQPTESQPTAPSETTQPDTSCSHTYGEWDGDEGSHWRTCTKCGSRESAGHCWAAETITVDPTCAEPGGECKICTVCQGVLVTKIIPATGVHTYDGDCDAACNVCGATREVTHTFGTGWNYSYKGHWHVCTKCGAAGEVKSHYPGPAATEQKDQICLTCGYIMTKKLAHSHKWASEWSSDDAGHWYSCSGCVEKNSYSAHTYDDPCDPDCNICGYLRQTLHEYDGWQQDEESHWQVCTFCGEESGHEAHTLDKKTEKCSVCQYEMEAEHEHEFLPEWLFDESSHWQECECGEKSEQSEHIWDEGTEEDGMITYVCETCGAEKQEEAPKSGFPWWIAVLGGVLILAIGGVVACICIARRKEDED